MKSLPKYSQDSPLTIRGSADRQDVSNVGVETEVGSATLCGIVCNFDSFSRVKPGVSYAKRFQPERVLCSLNAGLWPKIMPHESEVVGNYPESNGVANRSVEAGQRCQRLNVMSGRYRSSNSVEITSPLAANQPSGNKERVFCSLSAVGALRWSYLSPANAGANSDKHRQHSENKETIGPSVQPCLAVGLSHVFANGKSVGTTGKRLMGELLWRVIRRASQSSLAICMSLQHGALTKQGLAVRNDAKSECSSDESVLGITKQGS